MRGADGMQEALFTAAKLEDFVPADHPLRPIRVLVNDALGRLNGLFNTIYADSGRASIAPEKLLRAMLVQVFFSVRSERQLMEQVRYNLLYRWFIGLAIDDEVWDHSCFSKNRDRLIEHAVVESFFTEVMTLADKRALLSKEHFSVDGTLIQAWASHKSFVPKDGSRDDANGGGGGRNAQADWKGKPRSNDTHASTTDPDARLFRKSHNTAAVMAFQGHVLMENRSGLVVGAVVTHADGLGERAAAVSMLDALPGAHPKTLGADKAYDTRDFIDACRRRRVTPHVACNDTRNGGSAIDGRTTRHAGYTISQTIRKRIEEHFGWGKTIGRIRQTVYRGLERVDQHFKLTMTASNIVRMARILDGLPHGATR
ncbi:MAG: IS5 family transposase [Rubrivivax sp.]|nr:IS5 family transposase [Rubrivivax sp.]